MLAAPDGTILRANRALCELTGWPEDELSGRRFEELLHPDERGADAAVIDAILGGRTQRLAAERRILVADGSTRFVRINLSLIRTPEDQPLHFVGQIEDVTERRQMIEALTLSEARYKGLIAHLPDSTVHLFDHDLRLRALRGRHDARARLRPAGDRGGAARGRRPARGRSSASPRSTAPRSAARCARSTSTRATAARRTGSRSRRCATTSAASSAAWPCRATSRRGVSPSARWRIGRESSSAPTPSSSSSPTSPRTISPSRCAWSPATSSSCAAATTVSSTPTPTRSSTTRSTAPAGCATSSTTS